MSMIQFTSAHLAALKLQRGQTHEMVSLEEAELAIQMGPAWTMERNGDCIACGGFWAVKPDVAIGWLYLASDIGKSMTRVVRAIHTHMRDAPWQRIDFLVHNKFGNAHRMAKMLKAEKTGEIECKSRDGNVRQYTVYSRGSGHGWN